MFADYFAVVVFDTDENGTTFSVQKRDDGFKESPFVFVFDERNREVFVLYRGTLKGKSFSLLEKCATSETGLL